MKVTMIRHTAVAVPRGTCYGHTDVPLKNTFPIDAMVVASQLSEWHYDAAFSSPLSRCYRLAQACGFADAICDDRLMELDFGEWEMQMFSEIEDPRFPEWQQDPVNVRVTGGESFMDQHMRFLSFIDDLKAMDYERVAIFTHGGILMQAMLYTGMAQLEDLFVEQPTFGGMIHFEI